ncbi:MAG: SurA N-terminal domain-containing protein [Stagnimonas sp.]|nr:SurA N-terminal domain-containing protein [Stagnimonas sp.]
MLQTIRDRVSGPIIWAIIALIAIPFAFVGIESFQSGGADPTVAKVGDQKITSSQLEAAYQQRLQRLQQMLGENFRSDMIEPARFREGVLQEMIQETAMQQHAAEAGYTASNAAILDAIRVIPAFQKEGQFSAELYREALSRQGLDPQGFERQLRDGLSVDQIRDGVLASAFVTPAESAAAWRLARQERVFSSTRFKAADYEAQITVSDADITKHFAEQGDRYKAPERLKLKVVELDLEKLPEAPVPEAAVLKALYDADSNAFASSEERRARHLLIAFGADKSAALKKAQEAKTRLDGKADFAAVAGELSDDPGSKANGGDLGWVRKGLMTPKFEESLFALQKGQVSEPVETEFGWHLIKLEDVKPAVTKAFEDPTVQAELLTRYRKRDVEKRFQELSEKIDELAFEKNSTLDPVAEAVGGRVETTDWFTRTSGTGLTANQAITQAAFSPEVLQDNENSKPISLGANHVAIVRKAEYEPARARTIEEVREQIRGELKTARAAEKAKLEAEATLKAVEAGAPLATVAAEHQHGVIASGAVRRDAEGVDRALLDAAFRLSRPAAGKVSVGKAELAAGEIAVIALTEVKDATPETDDNAFKQQSVQLKDALAGAEFASFRTDLEARLGVDRKALPAADPTTPAP